MPAPEIFVKHQGLEEELKNLWKAWAKAFPSDAAAYIAKVQARRQQLWVSSGMSRDGQFAYTGMIPDRLYFAIVHKWPDFFRDPKNLMTAQRIWMGEDNLPKERRNFHIIDRRGEKSE